MSAGAPQTGTTPDCSRGPTGRLNRIGTAIENGLLVLLLSVMMVLAVGQIVLRLFFNAGLVWADELLKILVLWIALVASVAASRSRRHLRIDVLNQFLPARFVRVPGVIVDAFAAAICALVAWHALQYVLLTAEFQDTVLLNTPAWIVQGILPLAFALMSYRFAVHCLAGLRALLAGFVRTAR